MTPTLYYSPGACSLAPHIVLEWIGEPYRAVQVDYHDPEYRRINPAGAVPALDHGGVRPLTQCAAILNYLASTHPAAGLLGGRSPGEAAEIVKWTAFFTGDMHPAFWPVFMPFRYTTSTDEAALDAVRQAGLALVRIKLALLEEQLEGRDWIVGAGRTFVDAYATPMLNWGASMLPDALAKYPAVDAHRERMLADPAVIRAMTAEGTYPPADHASKSS
jgi:glutathione S-transferase